LDISFLHRESFDLGVHKARTMTSLKDNSFSRS